MNIADRIMGKKSPSTIHGDGEVRVKKKRFRGCKLFIYFLLLMSVCLLVCASIIGVLWVTGYAKQTVCEVVLEDSFIFEKLECKVKVEEGKVDKPDSDFPIKISEDDNDSADGGVIDVEQIYGQTSPAIVGIGIRGTSLQGQENQIIGSGFVISENGLIATNQHVVSISGGDYYVKFVGSDELVEVTEILRDPINDIAVIKISKKGLHALTLGNSDNLKPGQPVVAIGNPLGEFSSTVTSGIISGLHREVRLDDSFLRSEVSIFEDTIQTDAAINPGNSGGPLLDAQGRVVGINFATIQGYDNLSFAIPVNFLRKRADELRAFGAFKIPYLGIEYRTRLEPIGQEVFVGAQVLSVDPKGGAAGILEVNDMIIEYDGKSLEDTSLFNLIQKTEVGKKVKLIIVRGEEKKTVEVTIVSRN